MAFHAPLGRLLQWCFIFVFLSILVIFHYSPPGHLRSVGSLTSMKHIPSNFDRSHLPRTGWIKTHLPSATHRLTTREESSISCVNAAISISISDDDDDDDDDVSNFQRDKTSDLPVDERRGCASLSDVGLDGMGARTTRMILQHLVVVARGLRVGWCPIFSLTGW